MFKKAFKKLTELMTPKRGVMMLALLTMVMMPQAALAVTDAEVETYREIGAMLSIGMEFLQSLLWPFLVYIGDLLDADMITGPGMEGTLWAIWVQLRDLVNICFVLVLLAIAFYNTLGIGGGEGNLALKTALPRVIIGIVLVNFTFVGGKVVIDISNVATTAAFALPELVEDFSMDDQVNMLEKSMCVKGDGEFYTFEDESISPLGEMFCEKNVTDQRYEHEFSTAAESQYFARLNKSNISIVLAANMGAVGEFHLLAGDQINSIKDLMENMTFALFMTLVTSISFVVLGMVLIARIIVLWIAIAFSPLAVLIYVVPQIKDWIGGGGGDVVQKLIKHIIAPPVIGVVLTVGYIMVEAWDGKLQGSSTEGFGALGNIAVGQEVLLGGVSDLSHLIMGAATIAIIWIGVFSAASDTIAGFATNAIKGVGETVGKGLLKAPLNFATVPVTYTDKSGEDKKLNLLDVWTGGQNVVDNYFGSGARRNQSNNFNKVFGQYTGNGLDRSANLNAQLAAFKGAVWNDKVSSEELAQIKEVFEGFEYHKVMTAQDKQWYQKQIDNGDYKKVANQMLTNLSNYNFKDPADKREFEQIAQRLSQGRTVNVTASPSSGPSPSGNKGKKKTTQNPAQKIQTNIQAIDQTMDPTTSKEVTEAQMKQLQQLANDMGAGTVKSLITKYKNKKLKFNGPALKSEFMNYKGNEGQGNEQAFDDLMDKLEKMTDYKPTP